MLECPCGADGFPYKKVGQVMARGRMLSRTLGSSRRFNALQNWPDCEFYQLLFTLLVPHVDDFGRMSGDSFSMHLQVYPASRRSDADFEAALCAMHAVQLISLYVVDGDICLQVNKFHDHQQGLANRTASKIPPPPKEVCQQLPTNVTDYYSRARAELNLTKENLTKENLSARTKNKLTVNPGAQSTSGANGNGAERDPRTPIERVVAGLKDKPGGRKFHGRFR